MTLSPCLMVLWLAHFEEFVLVLCKGLPRVPLDSILPVKPIFYQNDATYSILSLLCVRLSTVLTNIRLG